MSARPPRRGFKLPSSIVAAGVTTMILLATYLSTAAPDLTFWDASELITAAKTLGIPHPPGTPLWVLLGHISALIFHDAGPARSVTMLSVVAGALTGGVGALMATRWIGARGAVAAAVCAGTMMSVWNNATEAEVYAVALLCAVGLLAAGERAGRHDASNETRARWRGVMAFLVGLALPLHLSVLVALPAAIVFAWRGSWPRIAEVASWCALFFLGLSAAAILPLLSSHGPQLDSGHPVTLAATLEVLQRKQYAVAGLWPRMAPLWLQLGNMFEWADWQVAYGLHPLAPPAWDRTALSIVWVWLAALGIRALWRHDARVGRAVLVLLVSGTVGVVLWLNMRAGPSYAVELLPHGTVHEARERDYFLVLGFWAWGLCAGAGLAAIAQQLAKRLPAPIAMLPFAFAMVPLIANREVADRTREPVSTLPRVYARLLLESVPANGVLYTAGDNDSFPLWYLQQVEQVRPDVLVITVPLLGARWYRAELASRHALLPDVAVDTWLGFSALLHSSSMRAGLARRPVRVSVLLSATERRWIEPSAAWALEGLVYAPTFDLPAGEVGLLPVALIKSADRIPRSALAPLPKGADPAAEQIQGLLRCASVRAVTDTLLVGTCNGS